MALSNSYQPGDFVINSMSIAGKAITSGFISASIYESIFMPCVVAEINVRDSDDALFGNLNLSGGEPFVISFSVPGGQRVTYNMLVNKPEDAEPGISYKSKTIKLICTSQETFYASGGVSVQGYIQKSYQQKLISDIVKDVLTSYLNTTKKINLEPTKGPQNLLAQNEKCWEFIDRIRRRAASSTNQSSSYVFFENQNGFNFVTIESMFKGSPLKNFVVDNTVGADMTKLTDTNIFAYELPHVFNAVDRISRGTISSRTSTFNFETNEYNQNTASKPGASDTSGGKGTWNNNSFNNKFGKYPGRSSVLPYDNRNPITNIPESTPNQLSYSGELMQNLIKLRVFGDPKLYAGGLIYAAIPSQTSTTGSQTGDRDVGGNMVIASLRHMITPEGERPRYSCVLECLKGNPTK